MIHSLRPCWRTATTSLLLIVVVSQLAVGLSAASATEHDWTATGSPTWDGSTPPSRPRPFGDNNGNGKGNGLRPQPTTEEATQEPQTDPARLGLHVTTSELELWRSRAASGPYLIQGDAAPNSPGDWTRIVDRKNEFLANPSAGRWNGPVANNPGGCLQDYGATHPEDASHNPPINPPGDLRDAAFYAMVAPQAPDAATAALAARDELMAQANHGDTRFGDRNRWCLDGDVRGDNAPMWTTSSWLAQLLFAYDYLTIYSREQGVELFTAEERTAFETWLTAFAEWAAYGVDHKLNQLFVDRLAGNYTLTSVASADYGLDTPVYHDGPVVRTLHRRYNNRSARSARFVALVGVFTGNEAFKEHGRRYVREALMFSYFPQGVVSDFERWTSEDPTRGWSYGTEYTGALLTIAEHLARAGDPSLYEFGTTAGGLGTEGAHHSGQPKSLATLIHDVAGFVDGTQVRWGTDDAARVGDLAYRIDSINDVGGYERIHDVQLIMGAEHYGDAYVRSVYRREAAGAPAYPVNPRHGLGHPEGGDQGIYPAMLFMFAS